MTKPFTVKNVHKQMYPATYNFRDEADGAEPSGWTITNSADCTTTIIASLDGHRKVLECYDNNAAGNFYLWRNITQSANQTIEILIRSSDTSYGVAMIFAEGATRIIYMNLGTDKINYYNGIAWNDIKTGLSDNTWYYLKIILDDTANTFDCWINGVEEGTGLAYENNSTISINRITFSSASGSSGWYFYVDNIGLSSDANYNVGDNCFDKYYKESTDSFEGDDVGTQGTAITWVDAADTAASVEIVAEFNEHKKMLRGHYSSGVGTFDNCIHNFASQAKDGWFEVWIKVTDVTSQYRFQVLEDATYITYFRITASQFQKYSGGAWSQIAGSPTPINNTMYHLYFKWTDAATDTIDCWIDNVFYETYNAQNNQTSGINKLEVRYYGAAAYIYLDAPMSSLDGDEKGDNRTFDYHDSYTREDITSDILEGFVRQDLYEYGKAILTTRSSVMLEQDRHLIEIYNDDDEILFIGNVEKVTEDINRGIYTYKLDSFLKEELDEQITQGYADEEISDVIVNITSNVGQADGPLILVDWDTTTSQFSLDIKNKPRKEIYKLCGEMENKIIIIKPNGKVYFDADKSSGITISDASNKIAGIPYIKQISKGINYVKIYGGFDSESGIRFVSTSSDSESITANGYLRWWAMFPQISNQTDLDSRALAIRTRTGFADNPYYCDPRFKDQGRIDCGETLVFGSSAMNITSRTWYVLGWEWQLNSDIVDFHLSNGLVEDSEFSRIPHRDFEEATDDQYARIYKTGINTVYPQVISDGVLSSQGWTLDSTKYHRFYLYIDDKIDADRDIIITMVYTYTSGLTGVTCDANLNVGTRKTDGSESAAFNVEPATPINLPCDATGLGKHFKYQYTLVAADFENGDEVVFETTAYEAQSAGYVKSYSVRYFVKKEII